MLDLAERDDRARRLRCMRHQTGQRCVRPIRETDDLAGRDFRRGRLSRLKHLETGLIEKEGVVPEHIAQLRGHGMAIGENLRQALLDNAFMEQLSASSGLCLEHFRLANALRQTAVHGDWQQRLQQAQLTCLERLDTQLGELIRKHDYRFQDEEKGPEMHAWKQAAALVGGEEIQ